MASDRYMNKSCRHNWNAYPSHDFKAKLEYCILKPVEDVLTMKHRVPVGLSSLKVLSGHQLVTDKSPDDRSEELVSLADTEQWLLHSSVPEWAARHVADNRWKWSDVGMPPARQSQPATQVLPTQPAASQEALAQQQRTASSLAKKATWCSPSSRSPSPPYARHAPQDSSLQTMSPAVARACVTLPGFFPDVSASNASEASTVLHTQAMHSSLLVPPRTPLPQTQQHRIAAAVHQSSLIPTAEQAEQHSGIAVTDSRVAHGTALAQEQSGFAPDLHLDHAEKARVTQLHANTACTSDDPLHSWISQVAVPKALPGSRLDTHLLQTWLLQQLDSLASQQAAITAAETKQAQTAHAAAAAAAVRAVHKALASGIEHASGMNVQFPDDSGLQRRRPAEQLASDSSCITELGLATALGEQEVRADRAGPAGLPENAPTSSQGHVTALPAAIIQAAASALCAADANAHLAHAGADAAGLSMHVYACTHGRALLPEAQPPTDAPACTAQPSVPEYVANTARQLRATHGCRHVVAEQLQVMTACFNEVCYEVKMQCQDRGSLLADLWAAMQMLVQASLADSKAAQVKSASCTASNEALQAAMPLLLAQHNKQVIEKAKLEQDLAAVKMQAASDTIRWREEVSLKQAHVDMLVAGDRGKEAEFMTQRVKDLQETVSQLRGDLAASKKDVAAGQHRQIAASKQLQSIQQEVESLKREKPALTPRPSRDLSPMRAFIDTDKALSMLEAALYAKVPVADLQQLLLGESQSGANLGPYFKWTGSMRAAFATAETYNEAAGKWGAVSRRLMTASLRNKNVAALKGQVPEYILDMAVGAMQYGVAPDSLVALLNGNVSDSGVDVTPFKDLGGLLGRLGLEDRKFGGPLTGAIKVAQVTTVQRFAQLQKQSAELVQELADCKQQLDAIAAEKAAAAKHNQKRAAERIRRRPEHNKALKGFLAMEWGSDFVGLGMDDSVPKYLRTNFKLKNRRLSKLEAELATQDIWNAKKLYEQEKQTTVHLQNFFYTYIVRKYGDPRLVLEVAYNLVYSWHKYSSDADCYLFLQMLMGNIPEDTHHAQQKLQVDVLDLFRMVDSAGNRALTGMLSKAEIKVLLKGYMSDAPAMHLQQLFKALDAEQLEDPVPYQTLFLEDHELNQGPFMELLRRQHLDASLAKCQQITDCILEVAHDRKLESQAHMNADDLSSALSRVSPALGAKEVAKLMEWGLGRDWRGTNITADIDNILCGVRRGGVVAVPGQNLKLGRTLSRAGTASPTAAPRAASATPIPRASAAKRRLGPNVAAASPQAQSQLPKPSAARQGNAGPKAKPAGSVVLPCKAVSNPRQAITLGPQMQNPDGSLRMTRTMSMAAGNSLSASDVLHALPSEQKDSTPVEQAQQADSKQSISHAFSNARTGLQDVSKVLMRQPSLHPAVGAHMPAMTLSPQRVSNPNSMLSTDLASDGLWKGISNATTVASNAQRGKVPTVLWEAPSSSAEVVSRLWQGSPQRQSGRGQASVPNLQLCSTNSGGKNSPAEISSTAVRSVSTFGGAAAADTNPQHNTEHMHTTDLAAVLNANGGQCNDQATSSLARAKSSRGSDMLRVRSSVSFLPAVQALHMDFEHSMPAGSGQQMGNSSPPLQSSNSSARLARYSSTLAAAVGQTMQDRMTAGGMLQSPARAASASDRCVWIKADPIDRCPLPTRAAEADHCSWPRSVLKKAVVTCDPENVVADVGVSGVTAIEKASSSAMEAGKSMPVGLSRHRSNLNKVSKRADFAAAMNAVRDSWVAEQNTKNMMSNAQWCEASSEDTLSQQSPKLHSSLDAVWESIPHHGL